MREGFSTKIEMMFNDGCKNIIEWDFLALLFVLKILIYTDENTLMFALSLFSFRLNGRGEMIKSRLERNELFSDERALS
jgi:hypothetical protein